MIYDLIAVKYDIPQDKHRSTLRIPIYLSGLVTAAAVFRNPNTIPFCLNTDLLLKNQTLRIQVYNK
jgi:hypothetical protein